MGWCRRREPCSLHVPREQPVAARALLPSPARPRANPQEIRMPSATKPVIRQVRPIAPPTDVRRTSVGVTEVRQDVRQATLAELAAQLTPAQLQRAAQLGDEDLVAFS